MEAFETRKVRIRVIMVVLCEEGRTYDGSLCLLESALSFVRPRTYTTRAEDFLVEWSISFFTDIILLLAEFRETQPIAV
jgi:hypothetical protein